MIKHIYTAAAGLLLLASACQKEDQNFKYETLNKVSIETTDSTFTLVQLDTLRVKPVIHETKPEGAPYTYEWKIYPQTGDGETVVLATEKDLEAVIRLSPGSYYLQYTVTDSKSGIASFMQYPVFINGAFYEGWLVANNKGGNAQLSFVRADDEVFLTPAESVNKTTYPGNALGVYAGIGWNIALINFFTDKGAYRFNANDLLQNGTTTSFFPNGKQFGANIVYGLGKYLGDQYIIDQGGLYAGIGPAFYPGEVLSSYSERLPGDYLMFPAVIASDMLTTYFYDNKHKRFMQTGFMSRELAVSPGSGAASFNMANVGKTMIASDYGLQSYALDEYYFVMRDDNGTYLYSLQGVTPGLAQMIGNSPDINTATTFATSSVVKHLYYAAGNKVYLYDILANTSRLVYTFPAGYTIRDIEMLRSTGKRLVVAVNKGVEGEVYYFELDNLGDFIDNTYSNKFTGFGEIVQISYRNEN